MPSRANTIALGGAVGVVTYIAIVLWFFRAGTLSHRHLVYLTAPVAVLYPLSHLDTFANWDSAPSRERFRAAGSVITAGIVVLVAAIWGAIDLTGGG